MSEISVENYIKLKNILEKEYGRTFTLEETKEIGDGYVEFYQLLMEEKPTSEE